MEERLSPIPGAEAKPISREDGQAHDAVVQQMTDEYVLADNSEDDLDRRLGHIERRVLGSELTEKISYLDTPSQREVAYNFAEGHRALYLYSTADESITVDLVQNGYNHDLAVFVDKRNASRSLLYSAH